MSAYTISDSLKVGSIDVSTPGGISVTDGLGGVVTLRADPATTSYTLTLPADTGALGDVLTEDTGTGDTIWAPPPTPIYAIWSVRDVRSQGTNGGTAGSIDTWLVRPLNTLTKPSGTGTEVTLSGNSIVLQDGVYWIECYVPNSNTLEVASRIRNVTTSSNIAFGTVTATNVAFGAMNTASSLKAIYTVSAGPEEIQIEQYFKNITSSNTFGLAANIPSTNEVFTTVTIQLVG